MNYTKEIIKKYALYKCVNIELADGNVCAGWLVPSNVFKNKYMCLPIKNGHHIMHFARSLIKEIQLLSNYQILPKKEVLK